MDKRVLSEDFGFLISPQDYAACMGCSDGLILLLMS
jgi:hypothetical protein